MLRAQTPLTVDAEALINRVIGCCITVHRALGPGLLESIYSRAAGIELEQNQIPFEREKEIKVSYAGQLLCVQRLDFVVAGIAVLEIKAVDRLAPVHHAQLLGCLRLTDLRVGLLINFNVAVLKDGIKRIVL